jgi:hypothetical protein
MNGPAFWYYQNIAGYPNIKASCLSYGFAFGFVGDE